MTNDYKKNKKNHIEGVEYEIYNVRVDLDYRLEDKKIKRK